jgi:hypothetical protein
MNTKIEDEGIDLFGPDIGPVIRAPKRQKVEPRDDYMLRIHRRNMELFNEVSILFNVSIYFRSDSCE